MLRIFALAGILLCIATGFACSATDNAGGGTTPTEAYKNLFAAVKAKDNEAIKRNLSKKTIDLGAMQSTRSGTPIEAVYANGFTETTFASTIPTIRDERVNGNMGALEVWNTKNSAWDDLPFVNEDGRWRLAIGDIFAGGYQKPGKGRDEIEKEAANVMNPPPAAPQNSNSRGPMRITVPQPPPADKK